MQSSTVQSFLSEQLEADFSGSTSKLYTEMLRLVGAATSGLLPGAAREGCVDFFGDSVDANVFPADFWELMDLLSADGGQQLLVDKLQCNDSACERTLGRDAFHVSELSSAADAMVAVPRLNKLLIAVREVLAGQCWAGAEAKFFKRDSAVRVALASLSYVGPTGVATYGVALLCASLVAVRMHKQDSDFVIPEAIINSSCFYGILVAEPADPEDRVWSGYEMAMSSSLLNVKPTEFDLRKSILKLQRLKPSLTSRECVEECQRRQKATPDRKLRGNAIWRMSMFIDKEKFVPESVALVEAALELVNSGQRRCPKI